jgi:hypothetical protein
MFALLDMRSIPDMPSIPTGARLVMRGSRSFVLRAAAAATSLVAAATHERSRTEPST